MTELKVLPDDFDDKAFHRAMTLLFKEFRRGLQRVGRQLERLFPPPRRPARVTRMRSSYHARKGKRW